LRQVHYGRAGRLNRHKNKTDKKRGKCQKPEHHLPPSPMRRALRRKQFPAGFGLDIHEKFASNFGMISPHDLRSAATRAAREKTNAIARVKNKYPRKPRPDCLETSGTTPSDIFRHNPASIVRQIRRV
jgi:hypothetical protein